MSGSFASLRNTWLHPRYIATRYLWGLLEKASAHASGVLVDVGCGLRPYESIFQRRVSRYVGLDLPVEATRARADVIADVCRLPLVGECADTVLATEVIEHLDDPDRFLQEVWRVLRPGGTLILSAPFLEPVHEEPRDFFRFTPYGLRAVLTRNGFGVQSVLARGGWWSVVIGSFVSQTLYECANPIDETGRRHRPLWGALIIPVCTGAQFVGYQIDRVVRSTRYSLGYVAVATRHQAEPKVSRRCDQGRPSTST